MAEFAYNNSVHSALGVSPYFVETGRNPREDDTARPLEESKLVPNSPAALDRVQALLKHRDVLSERLREATEAQRHYAASRSKAHQFSVGDKVWLSTKNLATARPSKKLDKKFVGPFTVLDRVGSQAYRLDLPKSMSRIHNVFHVSLLEPHTESGREQPGHIPTLHVKGEDEYEVEKILDSKRIRNKLVYLVKWVGYSEEENTWEPPANLTHADDTIAEFHREHPEKPSPSDPTAPPAAKRKRNAPVAKEATTRTRSGRISKPRVHLS